MTKKGFLLLSRDAICGSGVFMESVTLDDGQCKDAGAGATSWESRLNASVGGRALVDAVREELSPGALEPALSALGKQLCNFNKGA